MPTRVRKPKPVFRVRKGSRLQDRDAAILGKEFTRLEKTSPLTPQRLVSEAESRDSVLHGYFEWNNSQAAEQYRLSQARHLLAAVVVVYDRPEGEVEVRGWYNVRQVDNGGERVYASLDKVEETPLLRAQVVAQAKKTLDYWLATYAKYEELFPVTEAIRQALDEIG